MISAMNTQKTSRKLLAPVIGLAFFLAACGGGSGAPSTPEPPAVQASVNKCVSKDNLKYAKIQDSGKSATLQGQPQYGNGLDNATLKCVLTGLDMPDSTWSKMTATRAMDGMQSGKWSNYEASWTYHPDNGLQVILSTSS
jgi:hypothetical protein